MISRLYILWLFNIAMENGAILVRWYNWWFTELKIVIFQFATFNSQKISELC